MDGRTNKWTENLTILQDFVPYWGRCPATAQLRPKNRIKQGKGTADYLMPWPPDPDFLALAYKAKLAKGRDRGGRVLSTPWPCQKKGRGRANSDNSLALF